MAYKHQKHLYNKHRRVEKLRRTIAILIIFFVGVSGWILIDWLRNEFGESQTAVSQETVTSVLTSDTAVYRNEFFQFQAPQEWVNVENETTKDKIVYVKRKHSLIVQRLEVIIDRPQTDNEADFKLTRVYPVRVIGNGLKSDGDISAHCGEVFDNEKNRDPARITVDDVSFVCNPDSGQYTILIGEKGGNENLKFIGSDGKELTLTLVFSDLTAYPDEGDLKTIVDSFEVL